MYSLALTCFFLCPDCSAFCLFFFTYNTQHKNQCPRRGFVLSFFVLIVLAFAFCPFCTAYTTQNIHATGGIRTGIPSRSQTLALDRSATGLGNRTRDLPDCSEMPQPTAPPRVPQSSSSLSSSSRGAMQSTVSCFYTSDGRVWKLVTEFHFSVYHSGCTGGAPLHTVCTQNSRRFTGNS